MCHMYAGKIQRVERAADKVNEDVLFGDIMIKSGFILIEKRN